MNHPEFQLTIDKYTGALKPGDLYYPETRMTVTRCPICDCKLQGTETTHIDKCKALSLALNGVKIGRGYELVTDVDAQQIVNSILQ